MTFFSFTERVIIPALLIFVLVGSLGGVLLGCGLVFRSAAALRFVSAMNRWFSSRRALKSLEVPRSMEQPGGAGRNIWLGAFLVIGGALGVYFLLARLNLARVAYVPKVDLMGWLFSGIALQLMKWFLVAGSAFAVLIGLLILLFPQALSAFEGRMNRWYSTRHLVPAESESMRMPLEALAQTYPRASGWVIAAASLLVALAMTVLLIIR